MTQKGIRFLYVFLAISLSLFLTFPSVFAITYTSNNPTVDGRIDSAPVSGSSCGSGGDNKDTTSSVTTTYLPTTVFNPCYLMFFEWDTSSIPDNSTITNVVFKFNVTESVNAHPCNFTPMATQPSGASNSQIWDDVVDGTPYVNSSSICQSTGSKTLALGTAAESDVQSGLTSDYFAVGIRYDTMTRDGAERYFRIATEESTVSNLLPTLEITYTSSTTNQTSSGNFVLVATSDVSKQKNNLGISYADIYDGAFEPDFNLINFTGYTQVRILAGWDYNSGDTGSHQLRWVDANDNSKVLHETSTFTIDQDPNDSGWIDLPTWATNETTVEWQGKSTVSADDPIAKYFRIFLR